MRPRRGSRRTLAAVIVLVFLPIATCVGWRRTESARLSRALDAIEARGEPLDFTRLDPGPTTDEQRQASHDYAEAGRLTSDAYGPKFSALARTIDELCGLPDGDPGRGERLTALRRVEDRYAPALALLDKASALDARGWDDHDKPSPQSMEGLRPRYLAIVNAVRIARQACGAKDGAAAGSLLGTLRLARVRSSSFVPGAVVPTGHGLWSVLTLTPPPEPMLHQLQDAYAATVDERALERTLLMGRARVLDFMLPGELSDAPRSDSTRRISPPELFAAWIFRPLREHGLVAELDEYAEAIDAAKHPWPAGLDAAASLARKYQTSRAASPRRRGFVETMGHPFGRHIAASQMDAVAAPLAESLALARASTAAVAVARYQRAHGGAMPASLSDLVPAYLAGPLIDPFTGGELKYMRDGAKYKVYSVGMNRQDDGGAWERHADLQTSRRGHPKDVGVAIGAWPAGGPVD